VKAVRRWFLLTVPLLLVLLFAAAWLLVDIWLESAGGRQAVERALAERIGLPVRLEGEFHVMLLPSIGVSGTVLVLGEPGQATELARSEEYAVSLALAPLLESRLLIESVRFSDGILYLDRWPGGDRSADAPAQAALALPDIRELAISDFRLVLGPGDDSPYLLRELSIEEFTPGRLAPLRLRVEGFGTWRGGMSWQPADDALELTAAGTGQWAGELGLQASMRLNAGTGQLALRWVAIEPQLSLAYAALPAGVRLEGVRIEAEALRIEGVGCFLAGEPPALHLDLAADRVDTAALPDLSELAPSAAPAADDQADPEWPEGLDFGVRLAVGELLAGDAVARQAVLQLGGEPDCRALSGTAVN
jgi:hypothetical protein